MQSNRKYFRLNLRQLSIYIVNNNSLFLNIEKLSTDVSTEIAQAYRLQLLVICYMSQFLAAIVAV